MVVVICVPRPNSSRGRRKGVNVGRERLAGRWRARLVLIALGLAGRGRRGRRRGLPRTTRHTKLFYYPIANAVIELAAIW